MSLFLRFLLLFATAVGLAVASRYNPGNVVFFFPPYRIDLSLNFFLLLTALLFWLIFLLLNALAVTQKMPSRVAQYRREKREREGNRALRDLDSISSADRYARGGRNEISIRDETDIRFRLDRLSDRLGLSREQYSWSN